MTWQQPAINDAPAAEDANAGCSEYGAEWIAPATADKRRGSSNGHHSLLMHDARAATVLFM